MGALLPSRWRPERNACYQPLIAAGKPEKVALTALMRKRISCSTPPSNTLN
jgi:hypothetical protein